MTKHEKEVIEVLRLHVSKNMAEDVQHESYPEEMPVSKWERPCDATWTSSLGRHAIEHTTIDSFLNQRADDDRFRRVMGNLENGWSAYPDNWIEVAIDVGVIETGVDWQDLSNQIKSWLLENVPSLPLDCQNRVKTPDIPFDLLIRRELLPGAGKLLVARYSPKNLSEQRVAVIRKALDKKAGAGQQYRQKGYLTVLVLEANDIALASRVTVFKAIREAYQSEADEIFDRIFIAMTAANPWCIVPFKLEKQIMAEPTPYWPTAPGYPLGVSA